MNPETVQKFKQLYSEKKEIIEYLERFGNQWEQTEAKIIKQVALSF
mgnify:CR=1 FL=1